VRPRPAFISQSLPPQTPASGLLGGSMVNGTGRVNGVPPPPPGYSLPPPPPPRSLPPRVPGGAYVLSKRSVQSWTLAVLLGLALPVAVWLLVPETLAPRGIVVDGSVADWVRLNVPKYQERVDPGPPDSTLTGYAYTLQEENVYFSATVEGRAFGDDAGYNGAYFFLDVDGNPDTGYRLPGLGADRVARAAGTEGAVVSVALLQWSGTDQDDWQNWRPTRAHAEAAVSGGFIEVGIEMAGFNLDDNFRARVVLTDFEGGIAMSSVAFGRNFGALQVEQRGLTGVVNGRAAALLEVVLTAHGAPASLTGIDFVTTPLGLPVLSPLLPSGLATGASLTLAVAVDASAYPAGTLVTLGVSDVLGDRPVTLGGTEARAYVGAVPAGKRADGVFDDWGAPLQTLHDDRGDTPESSADLWEWSSHAEAAEILFYVQVGGTLLEGKAVLDWPRKGQGNAQTPAPVIVERGNTGRDFVRVYVDRDPGQPNGAGFAGINADFYIEVSGKWGRVEDTSIHTWFSGQWVRSASGAFFADQGQGEGAFPLLAPLPSDALVVIEMTPWAGPRDLTDVEGQSTRGERPPVPEATVPPAWPAVWTSVASDPNDGLADPTVDILSVEVADVVGGYIYFRFVVAGTTPVLTDNTWWFYIDDLGGGGNDYLVVERSTDVCTYLWDTGPGDWGQGAGCDLTATLTDADIGSAVRTVSTCYTGPDRGCVDFALERSDYPLVYPWTVWLTLAADVTEDLNLSGDTNRDPASAPGGCNVAAFDDCTSGVFIPEFPLLAAMAVSALVLLGVRRVPRRGRRAA